MSVKRRCTYCLGSGIQMGGGGFKEDCKQCVDGYIVELDAKQPVTHVPDKRSTQYKNAIRNLMAEDSALTREAADKILCGELAKHG